MKRVAHTILFFGSALILVLTFFSNSAKGQWQACGGPSGSGVWGLASDSTNLYAITWQGFYYSSNNGASWSVVPANGIPGGNGSEMAVEGNKLYVVSSNVLYASIDQGANFSNLNNGYTLPGITCIAANGNNLYLGTGTGVEVSTNNGLIWTLQNTGFVNANVKDILLSGSVILAATPGGVYSSSNNGTNWTLTSLQNNITSLTTDGINIYATGDGVYVSANNGSSWTASTTGLPADFMGTDITTANGNGFTCDPYYGVYETPLSNINWTLSNTGLVSTNVKFLTSLGTEVYCGGYVGIRKSINNASYWTPVNLGLYTLITTSMAVDSPAVYAGTAYAGFFRSDDFGTSWIPIDSGLPQNGGYGPLTARNNKVLAVVETNDSWYSDYSLYYSPNGGAYWSQVFAPIQFMEFNAVAIKGNVFFAGTSDSGVYVSHDFGATWVRMNYGLPGSNIVSFAASDTVIYVAVNNSGVFRSFDDGATWNILNTGLNSVNCTQLAGTATDVYVATGGEIYRSNNSSNSWTYCYGPIQPGNYITEDLHWVGAQNNTVFAVPFYYGGLLIPKFTAHSFDAGLTWSLDTLSFVPETIYCVLPDADYAFMGTGDESVWCYNTMALGIDEANSKSFLRIYPNPSSGIFNVEWNENETGVLMVRNVIGEIVYSAELQNKNRFVIDLRSLIKGIYLCTLKSVNNISSYKIILK